MERDSLLVPLQMPQLRGKGHKTAQCGKEMGKGKARKGVYGVDEGEAEDAGEDVAQDLGDLDLCAVGQV